MFTQHCILRQVHSGLPEKWEGGPGGSDWEEMKVGVKLLHVDFVLGPVRKLQKVFDVTKQTEESL